MPAVANKIQKQKTKQKSVKAVTLSNQQKNIHKALKCSVLNRS